MLHNVHSDQWETDLKIPFSAFLIIVAKIPSVKTVLPTSVYPLISVCKFAKVYAIL